MSTHPASPNEPDVVEVLPTPSSPAGRRQPPSLLSACSGIGSKRRPGLERDDTSQWECPASLWSWPLEIPAVDARWIQPASLSAW